MFRSVVAIYSTYIYLFILYTAGLRDKKKPFVACNANINQVHVVSGILLTG